MKLDKEEHRKFLLDILNTIQYTGNRQTIKEINKMLDEIIEALQNAEIEKSSPTE